MKYFLLFLLFLVPLNAGNTSKSLKAVRTSLPPVIDGYGNDEAWKQAETASGFVQSEPVDGAPESERTEFKIVYDDDNIYVYAMMYDSNPDSIVARLARRDDIPESDWFGIGFDSYYDKQTAFVFIVLPSGTKADNLTYNDGRDEDYSWDPVWESETRILPDGWSTEFKIPLSQIRFTEGSDTWGMNVARRISRKQEETNWSLMSKHIDGVVSQFGLMTGMADLKFTNAVELLPYAVGSSEHYPQTSERVKVERIRPDAGVDIKYGVTSNFTFDATFNPDFAQVEADPEVLNLTAMETFYPEKRPFFIEGTQIIRFVTFGGDFGPGLFYSRRIGRSIDVRLPDDGVIVTEEPRTATILGAAKFSGKTQGGTSIGVLTGATEEEEFSYRDTLGIVRTRRAEPNTTYNLFRVKQDFWGNSNVGGIVTATANDRQIPAYTAGADWDIKFDSNTYRINGFLAGSRGEKSLDRTGRIRSAGVARDGTAGKVNFARVSGEWTYSLGYDFTSKRYYINDIGFFRAPNDYGMSGSAGYRNFTPGEYFRSYNFSVGPHWRWNYDRMTLFQEINVTAYAQLLNYWQVSGGSSYSFGGQDPYEPRGFGVFNYPASFFIRGEIESDLRQLVIVNAEENFRTFATGGFESNTEASIVIRPTTSMEYEVSLGYRTERNLDKFVDTLTAPGAVLPSAVYGKRDVDGTDLTLRSTILFTHDLSLQIYNQFFWAKGSFDTLTYALVNPERGLTKSNFNGSRDFNRTSLISNVVLRWEYREGSTFYFVWSHGREFFQRGGYATGFGTNIDNTFLRTSPDNAYVVKISYWINL